jgi:alginate O-acetyltransferase complex protein AlgI
MLTGFWHGAEWNFVIWGLYYAIWLILEKLVIKKVITKIPDVFRWLYTMLIVTIGWVIFNITDFVQLLDVLKNMFTYKNTDWMALIAFDTSVMKGLVFLPLGILFSFPIFKIVNVKKESKTIHTLISICYVLLLALCIMFIISSSFNPFIYFRF